MASTKPAESKSQSNSGRQSSSGRQVFRRVATIGGDGGDKTFDDSKSNSINILTNPIYRIGVGYSPSGFVSAMDIRYAPKEVKEVGESDMRGFPTAANASRKPIDDYIEKWVVPRNIPITKVIVWVYDSKFIAGIAFYNSQGDSKVFVPDGRTLHADNIKPQEISIEGFAFAYMAGKYGELIDSINLGFQAIPKEDDEKKEITASDYEISQPFGRSGGGVEMSDIIRMPYCFENNPLTKIHIRADHLILRNIAFEYRGIGRLQQFGTDTTGTQYVFEIDDKNEYVNAVEIRSGHMVDGIRFTTTSGRQSPWYGASGGDETTVKGYITGIYGRAGSVIDQLGFFTTAQPVYEVDTFEFPNGLPKTTPVAIKEVTAENRNTLDQQIWTMYQYQANTSFTLNFEESFSYAYSLTLSAGGTLGAEGFGSAEMSSSATSTFTLEFKAGQTWSTSETKIHEESTYVNVPSRTMIQARVVISRASDTPVAFKCKRWLILPNGVRVSRGESSGTMVIGMVVKTHVEWGEAIPLPANVPVEIKGISRVVDIANVK